MPIHVRDQKTDSVVRRLAQLKGKGLTETIREACENELRREQAKAPLIERVRPLVEQVRAAPKAGPKADKAFFDELSGDG